MSWLISLMIISSDVTLSSLSIVVCCEYATIHYNTQLLFTE